VVWDDGNDPWFLVEEMKGEMKSQKIIPDHNRLVISRSAYRFRLRENT
jgi:hypothetical protein